MNLKPVTSPTTTWAPGTLKLREPRLSAAIKPPKNRKPRMMGVNLARLGGPR